MELLLIRICFPVVMFVVLWKIIWVIIGLELFKGLDKLDVTTGTFTHYSKDNKPYSLSNSSIICMMKDRQGTFWIGTYYGGVNLFNPDYEIIYILLSG